MFITMIIAVLAFPKFHHLIARTEREIAEVELLRMIRLAQKTALSKHMPVIICKSRDLLTCDDTDEQSVSAGELVMINTNRSNRENRENKNNSHIIYAQSARGSLHWQSYPWYRNYIMFMPNGLLASDNSTFWYCAKHHGSDASPLFAMFLSKSGRTRVIYPDANNELRDRKKRILRC